ncbi:MAG: M48 family metallopeptidase [bacterium]|nr:M48 family metallopeptidase [bacterium]
MSEGSLYLSIIVVILLAEYALSTISTFLNLKRLTPKLPGEMEGVYDAESYAKSQEYTRTNSRFSLIESTILLPLTLAFLLLGGFNWIDQFLRGFGFTQLPTGLLFFAMLFILSTALGLPFSIYRTFVIEEKFGFNRTTPKVFVIDLLKSILVTIVIGGILLTLVLWLFQAFGTFAWLYVWLSIIVVTLFMMFIAPVTIMPLFNKFAPLPEGELKSSIESFAKQQSFKLQGIYSMDGSRRSSKGNAYFTGFGKFRRIVLFDTIIANHTLSELVAILAHEIGHYKRHHIWKRVTISFLTIGLWCWLCTFFLANEGLFAAFRMEELSVYAGLVFFAMLFSPIQTLLGILTNALARKHEFEADAFAAKTTASPESMVLALKKLSVKNLSNLTPHPLVVMLHYDHPPTLERIAALRRIVV